jgi:predicted DNA-binding transcriptional regulator AlpA
MSNVAERKDGLLTIKEMAEISSLSESYFYTNRSLKTLDLPILKIGRAVRVRASDFYQWLDSKTELRR